MPSNKETLFQEHICSYLEENHQYQRLEDEHLPDQEWHIVEDHLITFIKATQSDKYDRLWRDYKEDTDDEIVTSIKNEVQKTPLWLIMRNGVEARGVIFDLYKPKPRTGTKRQQQDYEQNILSFRKEYKYNPATRERIDLVIWLNGLPIVVIEMKHEGEGQNVHDAIRHSFLNRHDLENNIYELPFLFMALSDVEAKVATNLRSEKSFRWFNADLVNKAKTKGEYPVEHVYADALSKESIAKYLEHYLVFVAPQEIIDKHGEIKTTQSVTIFPRYHQLRASRKVYELVGDHFEQTRNLGQKFLINHSAGSGKTLTIAWMADLLDSLYSSDGKKAFDNIIILTDRRALDKNVKEDLEKFEHLGETKINFAEESKDLAKYLDSDRDIIVTTIHKFSYIQEKLNNKKALKNRKVAFLIDEAHRSQDGKLALTMQEQFTEDADEIEELERLDISNQVYVAFTATTTPKTVAYFGEPVDTYSEEEAIAEGYILDVAQSIISYDTLYHMKVNAALPEKTFPKGTVAQALRRKAYEDDSLIQFKSEVIVKMFEEEVAPTINGKGKAMVVSSSRVAGMKYYETIRTILDERGHDFGVLYAFSDFTDEESNKKITEDEVNELNSKHGGKEIEDVFDTYEYRIIVVANKFQTGFDQPLLAAMFLDKPIKNVNAVQTVSRLNRKHDEKEQEDLLVVDFTNSAQDIFDAFNRHRKGSPYEEQEPSKELLDETYKGIIEVGAFDEGQIHAYVEEYREAEKEALKRNAPLDAILSNTNQDYKEQFKKRVADPENRKQYIASLNRYLKLYYFIAKFFQVEEHLKTFSVFAEAMSIVLPNSGKVSEMKEFLEKVELEKGALRNKETMVNEPVGDLPVFTPSLDGKGGKEPARGTIQEMIDGLKEKFDINENEAIIIKEIVEEVSEKDEVKSRILPNRNDEMYLQTRAKKQVESEIKGSYLQRNLYDKLKDPMYVDKGGIISLMGSTVVRKVLLSEVA